MIKVLYAGKSLRQRRRETILHPPKGIKYETLVPVNAMKPDHKISIRKKKDSTLPLLKMIDFLRIPNIRFLKDVKNIDLVHTPGQLLLNKIPYVVEIDNPACLSFYSLKILKSAIGGTLIKSLLKSKYCKKIICISEAAKKSMISTFKDAVIKKKLAVIYPYVKPNKKMKKDPKKTIFLCCNTKFYMKGTKWVIEAFDQLSKRYKNIELWIVSNTPSLYLATYKNNKRIKFFPAKFSKEELYRKFFSKVDVFVQPTLQDSFGLVYLEALANNMAIISTDVYAIPEFINDNGYLVKAPLYMYNKDYSLKDEYFTVDPKQNKESFYSSVEDPSMIKRLKKPMEKLIKDKKLLKKMQAASKKLIETKFSEKKRKADLKKIYKEAVK